MKRCLNCRKTYEKNLSECPFCGYKPRSKAVTKSSQTTQEFDAVSSDTKTYQKSKSDKNIYAASNHSGSFYLKGGERLNKRYSILSVMGFGAFGVAYECFDSFTQSNVVVKEYMPSYLVTRCQNGREVEPLSEEAEVTFSIGVDSFVDESNKLSTNDVSCVPAMIESFKQNNTSYVVTELVHGEALSSIIKRKGKLSYHATITIITGVLQGLRQLNKVGIIHGDICPDNIIVTANSDIFLLDYNLSDFNKNVYTQRDSGKLRAGYSALEMYYMNMEQGPWTDVYAAAATMYKMLTGITVPSAIKRKTSDTLASLSKLGVPITQGAEKAMFKALKVDYEKRTQNPEDFLNGLMGDGFDNISVGKEEKTYTPKTPSRAKQRPPEPAGNSANKILNGILIFLILAIVAVVIWLFISGIFTLPSAVMGLFNKNNDLIPDTTSILSHLEEDDEDDNSSTSFFFGSRSSQSEDESENESREESSDEDYTASEESSDDDTSSNFLNFSSWGENIESSIENFFSSEEDSSYNEDENYYDNNDNYSNGYYDEYGNYYEEENPDEQYDSDVSSNQNFGDTVSDFTNGLNSFRRYFQ